MSDEQEIVASDEVEDEEEVEDESGSDDEENYLVTRVENMRYSKKLKRVEWLTVWEVDGSKTWEPIECFNREFDHPEISDFRMKNPKLWKDVMKLDAPRQRKRKSAGTWEYASADDDDDIYEKPDEAATREARKLADPNRLEDPEEKFLKNISVGIEGRVSRSKIRDIKKTLDGATSSEPPSSQETPEEPTKVMRKKGIGRPRKKVLDLDIEKKSSPPAPKPSDPVPTTTTTAPPMKKEEESAGKGTGLSSLAAGIQGWKRKKRDVKLNSSDTSEEEEDEKRIEGGGNVASTSEVATTSSSQKTKQKKKKTSGLKRVKKRSKRESEESRESSKLRDQDAAKNPSDGETDDEDDYEAEFKELGLEKAAKDVFSDNADDGLEERKKKANGKSLSQNIQMLDVEQTETCLLLMTPSQAIDEMAGNDPLHFILMRLYENQMNRNFPPARIAQQAEQTVRMVRKVLEYVSMEVLFVQETECLNSLINCALNTKLDLLTTQLLALSTPLHIRNYLEMTPVETCVVTKRFQWLEEIIKQGGTYHHILETRPYIGGEDHDELRKFIANSSHEKMYSDAERTTLFDTVTALNTRIDTALKEVRHSMSGNLIRELGYGPIVLFPRGTMIEAIATQTIQFRIPEDWEKAVTPPVNSKFMLIVSPMAFNDVSDKFVASSLPPILRSDPLLCGVPCPPADPTQGTIYFKATNALKAHYEKVASGQKPSEVFKPYKEYPNLEARHEMVRRRIAVEFHPRVCTITLDIDPIHEYSFVACQLIKFEIKPPNPQAPKFQPNPRFQPTPNPR